MPSWLLRPLRKAFFRTFAYVKGVDVLGPTIVRERPENSPYQRWLQRAEADIPIHTGSGVEDVARQALQPWPQLGQGVSGLYLRLGGYQVLDGRLIEIAPGRETRSQKHFYEQAVYCIGGSGRTFVQQEGMGDLRVEWSEGDLFCVPLNTRHRHVAIGEAPARLLLVTTFPLVLNAFDSEDFVFGNPYVARDRYDGSPDYFVPVEDGEGLEVRTNLARDIRRVPTRSFDYRGKGNTTIRYLMAGNSMLSIHVSEMPPKARKRAHRQAGEAFVLVLSGRGLSLAWPEGDTSRQRKLDWRAGTLFTPPFFWYHQNMNPNPEPARYLAVNTPKLVRDLNLRFSDQLEVDLPHSDAVWEAELAGKPGPRISTKP